MMEYILILINWRTLQRLSHNTAEPEKHDKTKSIPFNSIAQNVKECLKEEIRDSDQTIRDSKHLDICFLWHIVIHCCLSTPS